MNIQLATFNALCIQFNTRDVQWHEYQYYFVIILTSIVERNHLWLKWDLVATRWTQLVFLQRIRIWNVRASLWFSCLFASDKSTLTHQKASSVSRSYIWFHARIRLPSVLRNTMLRISKTDTAEMFLPGLPIHICSQYIRCSFSCFYVAYELKIM
jgi:hypothetical protein